jgi:hypothetical protein
VCERPDVELFVYVAVKLLAYVGWSGVGLLVLRREQSSWARAASLGLFRLGLGVAFGLVIFFAAKTSSRSDLLVRYVAIYAPVRPLEWAITAALILAGAPLRGRSWRAVGFCFAGALVSFAADLASPEGVAGHFCVGRCLC